MSTIGAEARKAAPEVDLGKARKAVRGLTGELHDKVGKRGLEPSFTVEIEHVDDRGYIWRATVKAHVLTARERVQKGLIRARMANGVAPHLLDIETGNILEVAAHLSMAIDHGPAWLNDPLELYDFSPAIAVYDEVAMYEARFRGAIDEGPGSLPDADGMGSDGEAGADQDGETPEGA